MSRRFVWEGLALLLVQALVATASAQPAQFELNQFQPSEIATEGFAVSAADDFGHLRFGGQFYLNFADDPLVFEVSTGSESQVVHRQLTTHFNGALGLWNRFVVFVGLDVHLLMKEDSGDPGVAGVPFPDGAGLGALTLGGRGRIWGTPDDLFQIAAQATFEISTASLSDSGQSFRGGSDSSPFLGSHPEVLLTFNLRDGRVRLSSNLGFIVRPDVVVRNLSLGEELTMNVGSLWRARQGKHAVDVLTEIFGATGLSKGTGSDKFGAKDESPFEILAGAKYHQTDKGLTAGLALTMGLTKGYGAPNVRVLAMFGYARPDRSRKADMPPPDQDEDGVPDDEDACPSEPGDASVFGCPIPDRDGDGIEDDVDNCPETAGAPEHNGCLGPQVVRIEGGKLVLEERVFFRTGSRRIQSRSHALLDNVAAVLVAHPEFTRVRIEGHTDTVGNVGYNTRLSQRRAESVRRYLVGKGVAEERLSAEGHGPAAPIIKDAKTKEEHAVNRRVEIIIVDVADSQGGAP